MLLAKRTICIDLYLKLSTHHKIFAMRYILTCCLLLLGLSSFAQKGVEWAIEPQFEQAKDFSEGLAAVRMNGLWGYVTPTGDLYIPYQYEKAYSFKDGMARIKRDGKYGYINLEGVEVVHPQYYKAADFQDGVAKVMRSRVYQYIDKTGAVVMPESFHWAGNFSDGVARVRVGGRFGYIDLDGEIVIPPSVYSAVSDFKDGLAIVRKNKKYVVINRNGIIISPEYHELEEFSEGLAAAKRGSIYGYIDANGKVVIPYAYSEAAPFSEGVALVKKFSLYGYIDTEGKRVAGFGFTNAGSFSEGLAYVRRRGLYGYIDKTGNYVIPPTFPVEVSDFKEGVAKVFWQNKFGFIKNPLNARQFAAKSIEQPTTQPAPPSTPKADSPSKEVPNALPPILSIQSITFSEGILDADEVAELEIVVQNSGPGNAEDLQLQINCDNPNISFDLPDEIEVIDKQAGVQTIVVPVQGELTLQEGQSTVNIALIDPRFNLIVKAAPFEISTRAFKAPELLVAKYNVVEFQSANPNNKIDLNEIIDLKFAVQNVGVGAAEQVDIEVNTLQDGVLFLGVVEGDQINPTQAALDRLEAGKYAILTYRYLINSAFKDRELVFDINISEKSGRYSHRSTKKVAVNAELEEQGYIRRMASETDAAPTKIEIENVPDFIADVDQNLPRTRTENPEAIAVIIGNRTYQKTKNVDYALNDARMMKQYLIEVLGYREGNILYFEDAYKADFEEIFGTIDNQTGKLYNTIRPDISDVFIYYAGHGAPGLNSQKGYFVPVESNPQYVEQSGYALDVFYKNLRALPAKSMTIVLDACFSGADLFENISPVRVRIRNNDIENAVILTSSNEDQVSGWYPEKRHGLFTYFFLKAIHDRNGDANKDRQLTMQELHDYISDNAYGVPYYARRLHGITQQPQLSGDGEVVIVKY